MDKMDTYTRWKQNPSKGEVFTPKSLVNEMLDKIPVEVWENPKSIFCDLSMGKGTFLVEIVYRLVNIYKYSEEDAKYRVFGYENRIKYVNYLKRRGYNNLYHVDTLKEEINMKFDVVIGNPPYQKKVGPKKTEAIWSKFVEKSFEICKEGGYVSLIHPSGWRNVDGKFKETQKLLLSKDVKYLEIHNEKDGQKYFNATTSFDWYVVKNVNTLNNSTEVAGWGGNSSEQYINDLEFIPNDMFDEIFSLVAKQGEETVEILHSYSDYETRKPYMSKVRTEEHIYPCVYTTLKDDTINLMWSNTDNNGHFGVSKLIWSNGMASSLQIDLDGEYGLTQFAYAIVDRPENLMLIKKVMESRYFIKLINNCYLSSGDRFSRKILATFKKDFWRYFLDEDNNVIEPNFENVEQV